MEGRTRLMKFTEIVTAGLIRSRARKKSGSPGKHRQTGIKPDDSVT